MARLKVVEVCTSRMNCRLSTKQGPVTKLEGCQKVPHDLHDLGPCTFGSQAPECTSYCNMPHPSPICLLKSNERCPKEERACSRCGLSFKNQIDEGSESSQEAGSIRDIRGTQRQCVGKQKRQFQQLLL